MQKLVTINNHQLPVKEYKGQRVVTFKEIDSLHGRPNGTASRNFKSNKKHFTEGVDYLGRNSSEAKKEYGITAPNGLILITLSGYLMLVKSFTDKLAWKIQRELVDTYFNVKSEQMPIYEYYDKTYNGEPVITVRDFEYFTGVVTGTVNYQVRNSKLKQGKDFFLLEYETLTKFKEENPKVPKTTSSLVVITRAGFMKLLKLNNVTMTAPDCFKQLPKPKEFAQVPVVNIQWKKNEVVDVPENDKIQFAIKQVKNGITALEVVLSLANKFHNPSDYEKQLFTLRQLGYKLSSDIFDLSQIKPNVVEKFF